MSGSNSDRVGDDTQRRGIVQSLLMKALRGELRALSQELRVPFVFIKGAFSEPVLYGGRGERLVSDVDVLVSAQDMPRVAKALESIDYERVIFPEHRFTNDIGKEWLFKPTSGTGLAIDLHRGLANRPFALDPARLLARAEHYESVDGPILSLEPTDQVLYAAVHYSNHSFALDGRHFEDTRRLLERFPVDWRRAERIARRGSFSLALRRLREWLELDERSPIRRRMDDARFRLCAAALSTEWSSV